MIETDPWRARHLFQYWEVMAGENSEVTHEFAGLMTTIQKQKRLPGGYSLLRLAAVPTYNI